ncbi:hypothetical protein Tco_0563450 [Tanacetum coccineum]
MKMEILLEPTSNKLLVGDLCDSTRIKLVSTGKKRCYERPHKGVKASANSDIVYFFTSAQDGDPLQDDGEERREEFLEDIKYGDRIGGWRHNRWHNGLDKCVGIGVLR